MRVVLLLLIISCLSNGNYAFCQRDSIPILLHDTSKIRILPLSILNSEYKETNISITPDGSLLFFMSTRGGQSWSKPYGTYHNEIRYDGDIYYSERNQSGWTSPKPLENIINTSRGEDEPHITQDGTQVYFQSWKNSWTEEGGPYYSAKIEDDSWKYPQGLGGGIAKFFKEEFEKHKGYATDGMSISSDRNHFFVAGGPDYEGDMDIFYSRMNKGVWGKCIRHSLSTTGDERSLFLAPDGRSLYFASSGYGGFGGLDIFKAELNEEGEVLQIYNLGAPFNTPKDDYGFIISANGKEIFLIREGDIYSALFEEIDEKISPNPSVLIKGVVRDKISKMPLKATLTLIGSNQDTLNTAESRSINGNYLIMSTFSSKTQWLHVYSEGYNKDVWVMELPNSPKNGLLEIIHDFYLEQSGEAFTTIEKVIPTIGSTVVYFDFNKSEINPLSIPVLNEFFLGKNNINTSKYVLKAHTDSIGSDSYNIKLARKRAESVKTHLLSLGINGDNVSIEIYGERNPLDVNSTEEGRAKNRCVEIIIK